MIEMTKRGFTLIELLSVIVILAIIALIATPIVINIIENAKESATLRSADHYANAVELELVRAKLNNKKVSPGTYEIMADGDICLNGTRANCSERLEVDIKSGIPDSGNITITEEKIVNVELTYDNDTIIKVDGEFVFDDGSVSLEDICVPASGTTQYSTNIGTEYKCIVKDNMELEFKDGYTFYVLSTNNKQNEIITEESTDKQIVSVNLILDRNVYYNSDSDFGLIDNVDSKKGVVKWYDDPNTNRNGPVTAMTYLYNATKQWNKVPNIKINYTDEGLSTTSGYGGIITEGLTTKIKKQDNETVIIDNKEIIFNNLKARMPMNKEMINAGCKIQGYGTCPLWLVNYLAEGNYNYYEEEEKIKISEIKYYWTLASHDVYSNLVYSVFTDGSLSFGGIAPNNTGVRPVITLGL